MLIQNRFDNSLQLFGLAVPVNTGGSARIKRLHTQLSQYLGSVRRIVIKGNGSMVWRAPLLPDGVFC